MFHKIRRWMGTSGSVDHTSDSVNPLSDYPYIDYPICDYPMCDYPMCD